jgi:endonuclease/exonuclease/phosphatase (EEP) superfamily protein YafD
LGPRALWLWIRGARAQGAVALACIVAFVASTTELRSLLRRPASATTSSDANRGLALRLMTWNVAGLAPFAEVKALRPDVLFVQESGPPPPEDTWRGMTWIAALDPATLSRYPVRALRTERVGPWTEPQVLLAELPGGRRLILVNVRLVLPAVVITVAAGDWRALRPAHDERVGQFARLTALVQRTMAEQATRSVVLGGDFNCPGGMRSLDALRPLLRDAWEEAGSGWGGTMTAELPLSRIDQVWVSSDIHVRASRVQRRGSSDHRAVVVDLTIP